MDLSKIIALKGEFEAEGLARDVLAAEVIFAAANDLPYLVKIGGCEAKSDMRFLIQIGVRRIVAPMVESGFAMRKYMQMLPDGAFDHVGVTIETVNAIERIEEILEAGDKLTEVTVGRTDLTASFEGADVDCPKTISMVKTVAHAARNRDLETTMGGAINERTRRLLQEDAELRDLVARIETRKCVMRVPDFLEEGALATAFELETRLLEMRGSFHGAIAKAASERVVQIRARL